MASLSSLDNATMVVTSTYVMKDRLPILYISNDYDDEGGSIWQFHCDNGDYSMEKMLLVRLDSVLKVDQELSKVNLEVGEEARRESVTSEWVISKQ